MRVYQRVICFVLPVLVGVALGETTVAAMDVETVPYDAVPSGDPPDRYALGQNWAARHHPDGPDACPSIDLLFQSGCIAATRY